jgi:hypothetical protein
MYNPDIGNISARDTGRRQTKTQKHNTENSNDEQHGPHHKPAMNPCAREVYAAPASYKTPG